tara:strand:- start:594 stop:992 length:399 start_codon:yes stop_codon:yes gene_type:complete
MFVDVGDLVCLYRRKKPGLGLVVKHEPDAIKQLAIENDLTGILTDWHNAGTWREREALRLMFMKEAGDKEIAEAFMHYNSFYSPSIKEQSKIKKEFIWVVWIQLPSDYEMIQMKQNSGWFPIDWFKKYAPSS